MAILLLDLSYNLDFAAKHLFETVFLEINFFQKLTLCKGISSSLIADVPLSIGKLNTVLSVTICTYKYSVSVTEDDNCVARFVLQFRFCCKTVSWNTFLETKFFPKTDLVERNLELLAGLIHVEDGELVDVRDDGSLQPGLVLIQAVLH